MGSISEQPSFDITFADMSLILAHVISGSGTICWNVCGQLYSGMTGLTSMSIKKYSCGTVTHWEGFIRDIAISRNIEAYSLHYADCKKLCLDEVWIGGQHFHYRTFWESLTDREREYGIKWAKQNLTERLRGNAEHIHDSRKLNDPFVAERTERVLRQNQKLKVLLCPHSFEDDLYMYGPHIFDDSYYARMCHVGELSQKTPQYDWYLKPHPAGSWRDKIIIHEFLECYPNITMIPAMTSPQQLRDEGINFALTVQGTIGHEYPLLGIQVISLSFWQFLGQYVLRISIAAPLTVYPHS